ncbi:MAG: glycosyltransferase family 39 protein [Alphaproteobacteria bacterium]
MNTARWWTALALAGVLTAVALRLLLISVPLERDEGGYAYFADRWLQGDVPYVDVVDSKPPGIFLAYALILAGQRSVEAIRGSLILWTIFTALVFYLFVRRIFGIRIAGLAAALLAITQAAPAYFGFSANAEIFMATFTILALWLAWGREGETRWWRDLLAGAALGAATLLKPVAMADGLPVAVLVLCSGGTWGRKLGRLTLIGLGFIVTQVFCWGFFAALGAGKEMWFWAYQYNFSYAGSLPWAHRWRSLVYEVLKRDMLLRDWPLWLLAISGSLFLFRQRRSRTDLLFPLVWLFSAFVGVSASGRYTPHYWQQLLPPLCLLAAVGFNAFFERLGEAKASDGWKRLALGVVLALLLIYPTASQARLLAQGPQLARALYGLNPFMEGEEIGRYLAAHTGSGETIYIVGSEPQFLFHAKRRHASKIIFFAPLTGRHPNSLALQKEVWAEVEAAQPRYIVRLNITSSLVLEKDSPRYLFDRINALIAEQYDREAALVASSQRETKLLTENLPSERQGPIILDIYRRR